MRGGCGVVQVPGRGVALAAGGHVQCRAAARRGGEVVDDPVTPAGEVQAAPVDVRAGLLDAAIRDVPVLRLVAARADLPRRPIPIGGRSEKWPLYFRDVLGTSHSTRKRSAATSWQVKTRKHFPYAYYNLNC